MLVHSLDLSNEHNKFTNEHFSYDSLRQVSIINIFIDKNIHRILKKTLKTCLLLKLKKHKIRS